MKSLIPAVILLLSFAATAHAMDNRAVKAWQQDLAAYQTGLEQNHIDLYHAISKREFQEQLNHIRSALPGLNDDQVIVRLMRLTHEVGDGHTAIPLWHRATRRFPLELKMLNGKLYVTGTTDAHPGLLGARLMSINSVHDDRLIRLFSGIAPFAENPYSTAVRVAEYLPNANVLHGLGVIPRVGDTQFEFLQNGKRLELTLSPHKAPAITRRLSILSRPPFTREAAVNDDLWLGSRDKGKTVYIRFHNYPSFEKMTGFAATTLQYLNRHRTRNLIIDLRDNYGGDLFTGLALAAYLVQADTVNWKSGVYVLIDNVTFSAAMSDAAEYVQLLNAKLVGQPTGGRPSGYQDMGQFSLPNSKLLVTYSKRLFRFKDGHPEALFPDVRIKVGIKDYLSGTDKALDWILHDIKSRNRKNVDPLRQDQAGMSSFPRQTNLHQSATPT